MTELENLAAARESLRELARVVKTTRDVLAAMARPIYFPGRVQSGQPSGQLADTLDHMGEVREGFILSQRTSAHISIAELRALIRHVLLDWAWLQELNLAVAPGEKLESPEQQLLVYNHALVALGVLPHLPAQAVTFPQARPTYVDVTAPVLPTEMLERIEEIERIIYQVEVMPDKLTYEPFRRTYAFFEASTWLVNTYLAPLLNG